MANQFTQAARPVRQDDFETILGLLANPGRTSAGKRGIAVCFPNPVTETLRSCFEVFPRGTFVSEEAENIIGFAGSVRLQKQIALAPHLLSEITRGDNGLSHDPDGNWLYVCHLILTVGPGHSPLFNELNPLLEALKRLVLDLSLEGVVFAAPFPGFNRRSGTTNYQRSCIQEPHSFASSAHHAIGCALTADFEHEIAFPNYLGSGRHFALMAWRRNT